MILSVIIPTYHRHQELEVAIESIIKQTRLPEELLIIDDGDLEAVPLEAECVNMGIVVRYRRKLIPGLTASRNLAIDMARGDLLIFFDDDVALEPDYLERTEATCSKLGLDNIGGLGGIILNHKPVRGIKQVRRWLDILLLNTGSVEGRVLSSGFCANFGSSGKTIPFDGITRVDFLPGAGCAYPRHIFSTHRFSESYKGYGLGEDKDFSYRVSRQKPLYIDPAIRFYHFESPKQRLDKGALGHEFILSRWRFYTDHVHSGLSTRLAFIYAITGYTLVRIVIAIFSMKRSEFSRVAGIFSGISALLRRDAFPPEES